MKTPTPFSVRSACGRGSHLPSGERCEGRDGRKRRKLSGSRRTELCVPFALTSAASALAASVRIKYRSTHTHFDKRERVRSAWMLSRDHNTRPEEKRENS